MIRLAFYICLYLMFMTSVLCSTELIDTEQLKYNPQYKEYVELFKVPVSCQDTSKYFPEAKKKIDLFCGITVNGMRYASFKNQLYFSQNDTTCKGLFTLIGENKSIYSLYVCADATEKTFSHFIDSEARNARYKITPEWYASQSEILTISDIWSVNIRRRKTIMVFHKCYYLLFISFKGDENQVDIAREIVKYFDGDVPTLDSSVCEEEPFISLWKSGIARNLEHQWNKECNEALERDSLLCRKALVYRTDYEREIVQELADRIKKNPSEKFEDNPMRDKVTSEKVQSMGLVKRTRDDLPYSPYNYLECANGFVENYWIRQKDNPSVLQGVRIGVIYGLRNQEAIEAIAALRVMYSNPRVYSFVSEQSIEKMQDQARRFAKSSISLGDRCFQGTDPRTSDLTPLKKRGYELFFLVGNTAVMVVSYDENASNIVLEIATQIEQVLTGKKKSFTPLKTVSGPADSSK